MAESKGDTLTTALAQVGNETANYGQAMSIVEGKHTGNEPSAVTTYIGPVNQVTAVARGGNTSPEKTQAAQINTNPVVSEVKGGSIFDKQANKSVSPTNTSEDQQSSQRGPGMGA